MFIAAPAKARAPAIVRAARQQQWEAARNQDARKLYDWRWRKRRAARLAANPFCVMCLADGREELATVVDHVKPHRGDPALFWDEGNWQELCASHHNSEKQAQERAAAQRDGRASPVCDAANAALRHTSEK